MTGFDIYVKYLDFHRLWGGSYIYKYMKPNLSEIGKIVREMTAEPKVPANYNAAAAKIVQQGIENKNNAKASQPINKTKLI